MIHVTATPPDSDALQERQLLVDTLLAFIDRPDSSDDEFNTLALHLFDYQFKHNPALRSFCQRRGASPRRVQHWSEIPAVPIDAFKHSELRCEPASATERVFMTSGTTRADQRGRHAHPTLQVYDRSMTRNFARRFMQGRAHLDMAILFPDESVLPHSSLAHYLALASQEFGGDGSRNFMTENGLDVQGLCGWLEGAIQSGEPVALLGASFSFVHLFEALRLKGLTFRLPGGSRILDTGGYKGQSEALPLAQFYGQMQQMLGVPPEACINMYGMTELSTQFYDAGNAQLPSVKSGPHWIRSRVVDPLTGREVPHGERGILSHCDLGNFNSTLCILTEDVGQVAAGGFLLLGRAEGAQAKGCSLAVEEFVRAAAAS